MSDLKAMREHGDYYSSIGSSYVNAVPRHEYFALIACAEALQADECDCTIETMTKCGRCTALAQLEAAS
jgi:hypothetical protein